MARVRRRRGWGRPRVRQARRRDQGLQKMEIQRQPMRARRSSARPVDGVIGADLCVPLVDGLTGSDSSSGIVRHSSSSDNRNLNNSSTDNSTKSSTVLTTVGFPQFNVNPSRDTITNCSGPRPPRPPLVPEPQSQDKVSRGSHHIFCFFSSSRRALSAFFEGSLAEPLASSIICPTVEVLLAVD